MELLHIHEHLGCFNYDRSPRPLIEIMTLKSGQQLEVFIDVNEIVFFLKGNINHVFRDYPQNENSAGEFIFLPCGGTISLLALSDSLVMVFRLEKPIRFCENYLLENLYLPNRELPGRNKSLGISFLKMNDRVHYFLAGVNACVSDGLRCRHFFELKINELFLLLRAYYTKEQVSDFLRLVLTADTAFSEHIRKNHDKYTTVKQMAESMNLSVRHFSMKFKQVFHQTPYKWMKQSKSREIHLEITSGGKPLKQIAEQYGFSSMSQFCNFCKKELGASPSRIRRGIKVLD